MYLVIKTDKDTVVMHDRQIDYVLYGKNKTSVVVNGNQIEVSGKITNIYTVESLAITNK